MTTLLTSTQMLKMLKVAKVALEDRNCYELIARQMQMSNDELSKLYELIRDFVGE